MIMLTLAALVLFVVVAAIASPFIGWVRVVAVCLVLSFAIAPYPLLVPDPNTEHFGITHGQPIPLTFTLFLVLLAPFIVRQKQAFVALGGGAAFTLILIILNFAVWGSDNATWAGIFHFFTAFVALAVGISLASRVRDDRLLRRLIAASVLLGVIVQAVFSAAQLLGFEISVYDVVAYFVLESRPIGTFNHPSVLGKVLLLLFMVLLPMTRMNDKLTTLLAWSGVILSVPVVAATQSRANTIAILAAIVLWFLFDRRLTVKRRLIAFGVMAVASIPFLLMLIPRILLDPEGGDRAELLETGLEQIAREPWLGLGPNSYSQVVGQWSELAATGFPVHNAILLAIAELGTFMAILLFAPFAVQLALAWRRRDASGLASDTSRGVLAVFPGVSLIIFVGWGLLSGGTLSLWFFCIGITLGWMLADNTRHTVVEEPEMSAHASH